jgi:uncharacterized protein (TIGR00645 family)
MLKILERVVEYIVFTSRWIQAPIYLGLIVGSLLYAYKFMVQLFEMCRDVQHMTDEAIMLGILGLVDISMVANLVYMVVVGGYTMFVSKIDIEDHPDRPEWLEETNANTLKIKLASSLVGVSGIHLLKTFIEIGHAEPGHEISNYVVMWQVIIHATFLGSAIALALTERILHPSGAHAAAGPEEAHH